MNQTIYSFMFLAALAASALICLRRPFAGLMIVAALSPFYSLLRESSVGSAVFFVWPYVLVGLLLLVMVARESRVALAARGRTLPARTAVAAALVTLAGLVAVEMSSGLIRALFGDASLGSMGAVLSSPGFVALSWVACALLAALFAAFPYMMRRIEGRLSIVDVAVALFLIAGLVGVVVTYARNGLIFTGINGFRYYFALAITYLPARYFMRSAAQERTFFMVLAVACVVGAVQLLVESYLLNAARVPFADLPWAGPLAREFGYQPEPKGFFDAPFVPLGFMYMTHVSGLFLLMGFVMAVPVLLTRHERLSRHWFDVVVAVTAIVGSIWTSRTGLMLMAASYILAAALVRSTWRRRIIGALLVALLTIATARWFIPGARYDLKAEASFLAGEAVPNLLGAIVIDLQEMLPFLATRLPDGWAMLGDGSSVVRETRPGRYHVRIEADESVELRLRLPDWTVSKGDAIRIEARVTSASPTVYGLQVFDQEGVLDWGSLLPRAGTNTLTSSVVSRGFPIFVDVDVNAGGDVTLERVSLVTSGGTLVALGYDQPVWAPSDWYARSGKAERVEIDGAPVVKLSASEIPLTYTYGIPPPLLSDAHNLTVSVDVDAPRGQAFGIRILDGEQMLAEASDHGLGQPFTKALSAPVVDGQTVVAIDIPSGGSAVVHDVRVATYRMRASVLRQPLTVLTLTGPAIAVPGLEPGVPGAVPTLPGSVGALPAPSGPTSRPSDGAREFLFGHGAEFGTWNQVFFAGKTGGEFAASSYSDTKYLEFFQQFGLLGFAALLFTGLAPLAPAFRLWRDAASPLARAHIVGIVLMIFVGYASLLHLPTMFKVGFGTVVFIAMAVIPRLDWERRAAE